MTSDPESLHRQIDQLRQELAGLAPGDPRRRTVLAQLGAGLWNRVERYGALADLEEVIAIGRELLALTPPGDPWRSRVLADLGQALMNLFHRSGGRTELDPAVELLREAVALTPVDHPDRERYARRLSGALGARFDRTHDAADGDALEELTREIEQHARERDRAAEQRRSESAKPAPQVRDDTGSWSSIEQERGPSEEERARWLDDPFFARPPEPPPAPASPPPPAAPPAAAPAAPPAASPAAPPAAAPAAPGGPPAGIVGERSAAQPSGRMPDLGGVPRQAAPAPARPAAAEPADDRRLEFAAAYQAEVSPGPRYPFLFYVHRPGERDAVRALIERRAPQLGGAPSVARGEAAQGVRTGTTLTIVPNVLGATFEPSRMEVAVGDSLRELTFQLTVPPSTTAGPIDGYVDIFVGPLIIGQVPVALDVRAATLPVQPPGAKLMQVANASIFDKIFISYSQRDSAVIDLCVAAYDGLGVTVFLDRHELRSGDEWRAVLNRLITEADVFQLYWSAAAAASSEVQHEWRTALGLSKSRDHSGDLGSRKPPNFIRPLYWEEPLPPIPGALSHLHFSRLDLKQLRRAAKVYLPEPPGLLRRALAALRLG